MSSSLRPTSSKPSRRLDRPTLCQIGEQTAADLSPPLGRDTCPVVSRRRPALLGLASPCWCQARLLRRQTSAALRPFDLASPVAVSTGAPVLLLLAALRRLPDTELPARRPLADLAKSVPSGRSRPKVLLAQPAGLRAPQVMRLVAKKAGPRRTKQFERLAKEMVARLPPPVALGVALLVRRPRRQRLTARRKLRRRRNDAAAVLARRKFSPSFVAVPLFFAARRRLSSRTCGGTKIKSSQKLLLSTPPSKAGPAALK